MNMKKKEWCVCFFCQSSSLVIILLHDIARSLVVRITMLGHLLLGWKCSAPCCQDDNDRPLVGRRTMFGYMLPGWYYKSSLTWDTSLCYIHHILLSHPLTIIFFKHLYTFFMPKTFCSIEVKITFKDFLTSKPLKFYHNGINNLVNRWQKCTDVRGSYFDWLKYCLNSLIQEQKFISKSDGSFRLS